VMASSFATVLEMVREGALDMHQDTAFGPLFLRKHSEEGTAPPTAVQ
jgi:segregation and condensation protein A